MKPQTKMDGQDNDFHNTVNDRQGKPCKSCFQVGPKNRKISMRLLQSVGAIKLYQIDWTVNIKFKSYAEQIEIKIKVILIAQTPKQSFEF